MENGTSIEFDLLDAEFLVELNHLFLAIPNETPDIIHADNRAVYRMTTSQNSTGQVLSTRMSLRLKSFSTTTFNTYTHYLRNRLTFYEGN